MEAAIKIIIPTYNASGSIRILVEQLVAELGRFEVQIILVDDASADNTRDIIRSMAKDLPCIDYCFLPRNKGQQAALLTGLKRISAPCDYVITMDDDLQNPVDVIPLLIAKIESGYDLVYAVPTADHKSHNPAPSAFRRLGSRFRDLLFDSFTNKPPGIKVSAFRIMTCDLAMKIAKSEKKYFYLSAEAFRYKIRTANVTYTYVPRLYGRSSYHIGKLLLVYWKLFLTYKLNLF